MDWARQIDLPSRPPVYADFNKNGRHLSTAIRPQSRSFRNFLGMGCASLLGNGRFRTVSRNDHRGAGERQQPLADRLHEGRRRTAPKVGASDGAPKQRVAREQQRGSPPGGSTSRQIDPGVCPGRGGPGPLDGRTRSPRPRRARRGERVGRPRWPSARPTPNFRLHDGVVPEPAISAMQENASTRRRRHLARGHEVIETGVGVDELHRFQPVAGERLENAGRLVTGIHDQGFGGIRAGDDGAVAAE